MQVYSLSVLDTSSPGVAKMRLISEVFDLCINCLSFVAS